MIIINTHRPITVHRKKKPNTHIDRSYGRKMNKKHRNFFVSFLLYNMRKSIALIRNTYTNKKNGKYHTLEHFYIWFFFWLDGKVNLINKFQNKERKGEYQVLSYVFIYIYTIDGYNTFKLSNPNRRLVLLRFQLQEDLTIQRKIKYQIKIKIKKKEYYISRWFWCCHIWYHRQSIWHR